VRARHETGRAVIGSKVINHQDETEEWPIGGVALNINVQFLGARTASQSPRVQRAELKWPTDNAAASLKQWRIYVEVVNSGPRLTKSFTFVGVLPILRSSPVSVASATSYAVVISFIQFGGNAAGTKANPCSSNSEMTSIESSLSPAMVLKKSGLMNAGGRLMRSSLPT
jgi:hypothetical protein